MVTADTCPWCMYPMFAHTGPDGVQCPGVLCESSPMSELPRTLEIIRNVTPQAQTKAPKTPKQEKAWWDSLAGAWY